MAESWRLVVSGFADGATNMAIDEAILQAVSEGLVPPTLRFYGWEPPCLSVGLNQAILEELDLEECHRAGVEIVRRPTGGKAILHHHELTYTVVLPASHPLAGTGVLDSFRRISYGLLRGLEVLGLKPYQAIPPRQGNLPSPVCFEAPSDYEIECEGKKVIGSAQLRRKNALLQHGSIPLRGDIAAIVRFLRLGEKEKEALREKLRQRASTLSDLLGREITFEEATVAFIRGFREAFNLLLVPSSLTPFEEEQARSLRKKYSSEEWTFRLGGLK
ncbi:MAG: biotin/lipoate A/B protein ligase family protein [Anaerolineae bacterium]|nr:lipoate--protein ligase family protein [Anaerolineae bacterium]MDW8101313.1 biotin/lipoate A/B protein ligase family protein [Anaerolineae bacterium]